MSRTHQRPNGTGKTTICCKQCGDPFIVRKCHIDYRPRVFCSRACKAQWQREHPRGQNLIGRVCVICSKKFFVKPSVLNRPTYGQYCSKVCFAEARRLRLLWNNPNLRKDVHEKQMANWQDPELRERRIRNTLKGLLKRPTSLEQRLIKFFTDYRLPFKYVGDGSFLIGYKNPDFINIDGRKICIEVSNSFFHRDKPEWAAKRRAHFEKYGWDCIILETDRQYLSEDFILETLGPALKARNINF